MSRYVRDLSEAALDDELLQSKGPILVDFWAPWCGPCRSMSPAVEAAAQKLAGEAKVYKVNVEDHPSVSPRFAGYFMIWPWGQKSGWGIAQR